MATRYTYGCSAPPVSFSDSFQWPAWSPVAGIETGRWRESGEVADSLGIVGRVQSAVSDALRVVAEDTEFAKGTHDLLAVVHFDDTVIVLVADQGVAVLQTYRTRWQRATASRQVAGCARAGEALPDNVLVGINFDDTGVIRIRDQRVAVLQPAGKSDTTYRIVDVRVAAAVLSDNLARAGVCDLNSAVVVLVADEDVTVLQQQGAGRIDELVRTVAADARGAVLPDKLFG